MTGLPVPTAEIVEAIQQIYALKPPQKLMAVTQKLINCCPEAHAVLEEQVSQWSGVPIFPK